MNYINWLENLIITMQPEGLFCEADGMSGSDWCYENCRTGEDGCINRECLKRLYEIQEDE